SEGCVGSDYEDYISSEPLKTIQVLKKLKVLTLKTVQVLNHWF
ncbi:hypothetical protein A2U01_0093283, partial [Trifolium medium]|nr:hypothetical protein [Trifolium medium]